MNTSTLRKLATMAALLLTVTSAALAQVSVSSNNGQVSVSYKGKQVWSGQAKGTPVRRSRNINGEDYAAAFDGDKVLWENVAGAGAKRTKREGEALGKEYIGDRVTVGVEVRGDRHHPRETGHAHLLAETAGGEPRVALGTGRFGGEPSTSHPGYRTWIHSMIEDQVRNHDLDGFMWCNERNSPLDTLIQGGAPGDFSPDSRREAAERGVNVEACRQALLRLYDFMQESAAGKTFHDGSLITFLRTLLDNPEALVWEKFWLERNKDLDRELYGLVKWCKPNLPFGLNIWNRNHFNLIRRAQWPWAEQTRYADFVKPITYQHQAGEVWAKELSFFRKTVLRDFEPGEATTALFRILGLNEAPFADIIGAGMDPDTYVFGQCADAVKGVEGKARVYMGIGIDAPRSRPDTAKMTSDIAYRSIHATYRAGGHGVVLAPNYTSMHLTHLDGVAQALTELGLK